MSLRLFEGYGVELEYMVVDRSTLDVRPIVDEILRHVAGSYESEVELGVVAWSNELVLHVVELKTNGPAASLDGWIGHFQSDVRRINEFLAGHNARLMPGAAHPWMDPHRETRLWPHEQSPIYESFDRVFGCQGHGWSNLQSLHLNLPFRGDEEFGRLHAAIRAVLPILPAIAASSPCLDGRLTGLMDSRLEAYRLNCARIPSVTGQVIPEPVYTRPDYEENILGRMYRDIAGHDPDGTLQEEWLNARGAIARFERDTIEIRLIDIQECPLADLAITALLVAVIRALVEETWCDMEALMRHSTDRLEDILRDGIRDAEAAIIDDRDYLRVFGCGDGPIRAGGLWAHLAERVRLPSGSDTGAWRGAIEVILRDGTLARRIQRALGTDPERSRMKSVYERLCESLEEGELFRA